MPGPGSARLGTLAAHAQRPGRAARTGCRTDLTVVERPVLTRARDRLPSSSGAMRSDRRPGRPRPGVDVERGARESLRADRPQARPLLVVEPGDVPARRADSERVRMPPRVEGRVADGHRD